jgi:hypothetical protein
VYGATRYAPPCRVVADGAHATACRVMLGSPVSGALHCVGVARGCAFFWGESGSRYAPCLLACRRLGRLLEQFQKPLSASSRKLPHGQPFSWDTGAGRGKGCCLRVLRERLGKRTRFSSDVVGLCLALHRRFLQHTPDRAQLVVYDSIRNRYSGQRTRSLAQENRGHHHFLNNAT